MKKLPLTCAAVIAELYSRTPLIACGRDTCGHHWVMLTLLFGSPCVTNIACVALEL